MAETLGEKLRHAREERGISISEVAEQTRISSLYLESIEKDDYKILPGGIFNKGFIKYYAKYIGYDEHQALQENQKAVSETEAAQDPELRLYKPEVLTDDRSGASMAPTIIFAVIILGLVTAGILFLVNYIQNRESSPVVANTSVNSNSNISNTSVVENIPAAPSMENLQVEFSTVSDDVSVTAQADGRSSSILVSQDKPAVFTAKEILKLSYSKSLAHVAQLKINGRSIELPSEPENPRRADI
jgi:cytoskeletal protein RodZ